MVKVAEQLTRYAIEQGMSISARNNVHVFGQGDTPLLFAHGFGCDQNVWRFITPAFESDYRIVLFDYIGHGKSDWKAYNKKRYNSLNGYADDILEICDFLKLQSCILVAHSVSSMICLLAALQEHERFQALIMISPSPRYLDDPPDYVGGFSREDIEQLLRTMDMNGTAWADYLAPQVMGKLDAPYLTIELKKSFCSTDPVVAREFAEVTFLSDNREDLPRLRIPSLILQCADDVIAPVQVGKYTAERVPGSSLRVLDVASHCPHMSAPQETITAMKDFLRSLPSR